MQLNGTHLRWSALAALTLSLTASEADACGGLFCSAANPVNQAAERIIFAQDAAAGRVTAVIEILYEGPAERFAWILPVAGTPDVGVSTNAMLNRLQQATNPNFQIQRTWSGDDDCDFVGVPSAGNAGGSGGTSGLDEDGGGSVSVLSAGNAGPYDYQVISVMAGSADPAQVAIDWLTENGYDVGATGPDLLRPYLESGLNLLAVRLNKQASVGSIRPIRIAYDASESMIPIRPTAVAANDDMGMLVWVLGSSRAVPLNYKALELNEALIDWFNPQQSYNDVVIAAANEAGGQGFVTENARLTADPVNGNISDSIFLERFSIQEFRSSADGMSNAQLIVDVVNRFSTFNSGSFGGPFGAAASDGQVSLDGVDDALSRNLTLPEGVSVADVLESPTCYFEELNESDGFYCDGQRAPEARIDLTSFDRVAFLSDVEELVIEPLEQTAQLFVDQPYMTRFYTTLSAEEMSVDPVFSLNPDLADVSNQHVLELEYQTGCAGDISGPWRAEVDGRVILGEGSTWPLTLASRDQDMPVNLRVLQLSTSGSGVIAEDNTDIIESLLDSQFGQGSTPGGGSGGAGSTARPASSGGCSLDGGTPVSGGWGQLGGAGLLGLWALARARRSRRQ